MILVTGATGRVGFQVVTTLTSLNLPVRSLVRKGSEYYWLNETGTKFFFGDLRDAQSLRRALTDIEYLVVCSGIDIEERENNHVSVTIEGHQALFEAALAKGTKHVVMISCQAVGTDRDVPGVTARKAAEQALIDSGLSHTILRSSPHEYFFMDMAWRIKNKGSTALPGAGTNRLNPIPTKDLAMLAAASLDLPAVKNKVIEVGGGQTMTAKDALEAACGIAGVSPSYSNTGATLVGFASKLGMGVRRFANKAAHDAIFFEEDFALDAQGISNTFKIPLTSFDEALSRADQELTEMADPEAREKRMVHPQFYATVYEPGEAKLADLPDGPPPRKD
jgi:uncharacterized protein YbjT (DUF2867 family)